MEEETIPLTDLPKIKIVTEGEDGDKTRVYLDGKDVTGCLQSVVFELRAGVLYPVVTLAMYVDQIDVDVAAKVEKVAPAAV